MKRWFALFVALLMLATCCPALGESVEPDVGATPAPTPEPTFSDSLAQWAGQMDLQRSDWVGALSFQGEDFEATLRQDGPRTELRLGELMTLQLSKNELVALIDGKTYAVPLESISPLLTCRDVNIEDWLLGVELLQRAYQKILMPSVSITSIFGGLTLHFELDDVQLEDRLYDFIDGIMADGNTLERALECYGPLLRQLFPDMTVDAKLLREQWQDVKSRRYPRSPEMLLEADVNLNDGYYGRQIAVTGSATVTQRRFAFSFESLPTYDGYSARLSLDQQYGHYDASRLDAALDVGPDSLSGELLTVGYESMAYVLNASWDQYGVNATLEYRGDMASGELWFNAQEDPEAGKLTATLQETIRDAYSGEQTTQTLASLDMRYGASVASGVLYLPATDVHFRATTGANYMHASVKTVPLERYIGDLSFDLWTFRTSWGGYRFRADASTGAYGSREIHLTATGRVDPNGYDCRITNVITGDRYTQNIHWKSGSDGFEFNWKASNEPGRESLYYGMGPSSYDLIVRRDGREYALELSTLMFETSSRISAGLGFDESWTVKHVELSAQEDSVYYTSSAQISYVPGKLVFTTPNSGTVTIERVSESARSLRYAITEIPPYGAESGTVELNIQVDPQGGRLYATLDYGGTPLGELELKAVPKTTVEPLDTGDALFMDWQSFISLLTYGPVEEEAVPSTTESADGVSGEYGEATVGEEPESLRGA